MLRTPTDDVFGGWKSSAFSWEDNGKWSEMVGFLGLRLGSTTSNHLNPECVFFDIYGDFDSGM